MKTQITLDISIDLVEMAVGDDTLDESTVLGAIREAATATWPDATIKFTTLQVGHNQGDGWAKCWVDHERNDEAAEKLLQSIDWTDEDLYE